MVPFSSSWITETMVTVMSSVVKSGLLEAASDLSPYK
jgi:hypothetical protein